jgi:hypothetical protein
VYQVGIAYYEITYKCVLVFMQSVCYFCPDLTKIGIFLQILVKVLIMKMYEMSVLWAGTGGGTCPAQ